jgi:hypothetical protein
MRFPAFLRDASVASSTASWVPDPEGYAYQDLQSDREDLRRTTFMRASDALVVRGVPPPDAETLWNFTTMAAPPPVKDDIEAELEDDLVDEIARAMKRRPLMNRLAHVQSAYGELPSVLLPSAAPSVPPPIPQTYAAPLALEPDDQVSIDQLMEEFEEETKTPTSAEWLGKARRERSRARLRNLTGWLATIAIGGSIILITAMMLQH